MKTRKMGLIIFMAILAMPYFLPTQVSSQTPKGVMKGALHHNISADWFDPSVTQAAIINFFPLYLFHDALLKPMPGNMYGPCVAESWNISSDYRVYDFKLRKGVKFHNGDEVTADDVVFTFKRYKGSGAKILHDRIQKLEAVNPYLFRVTFKEPFPDFLENSLPGSGTFAWLVPKKYIEKVGDANYKRHPIGCGPYKLIESSVGVRFVGEAFEGFWRKVPKVKRLEIYSVVEIGTRYVMANKGEVDWAVSMVDIYYEKVKKDPALRLLTGLSPNYWIVYIASQWDPKSPWFDSRVRQAASLAINRKVLADICFPEGGPIESLGLPGDPETVRFLPDPYDLERAKKLLAEAGYPNGFAGGKFFPTGGPNVGMGLQIDTYWKAIGINLETVLLDTSSWISQRRGGKMKGGIFIDPIGAPTIGSRLSYLFGPQGYGNYPDIQALWDQYNKSVDANIRQDLIAQIQKSIYDKTMFIPLIKATVPSAVGPRVKGNPFKIRGPFPIWFPCPMEDLELND